MYQVIARKWRPQTFEDVTGQEAITRTLTNALEHQRLHHAYIFSGARGVGKTTTARLLAKAVNCHKSNQPTATPCAIDDATACVSCKEVAEGRSIDVLEIDAASNTGVDNVRDAIINTVGIRPARDKYKVFIIDEVHMLSTQAFNALLKTLEEPPPNVLFIMATTEAHKIPDTILSRSQQFEFRTIAVNKIFDRLKKIAEAENIDIDSAALFEIARAGEGSMRDAQSAFDQTISFSDGRITAIDVEHALGLAGSETLTRTVRAIAETKPADVLRIVDDLSVRGHDFRNFCRDLLAYLRDLLVIKVGANDSETEADAARNESLKQQRVLAEDFSESDLVRFFHSLTATERDLRESSQPRYQLELGLIKLIEMRRLVALDDILARLVRLEGSSNGNAPASSSNAPPNNKVSAPSTASPSAAANANASTTSPSAVAANTVSANASSVVIQTNANHVAGETAAVKRLATEGEREKASLLDAVDASDLSEAGASNNILNKALDVLPDVRLQTNSHTPTNTRLPANLHSVTTETPTLFAAHSATAQATTQTAIVAPSIAEQTFALLAAEAPFDVVAPISRVNAPPSLKLVQQPNESHETAKLTEMPKPNEASPSTHTESHHADSQVLELIKLLEARRPLAALALEKAAVVRFEDDGLLVEFAPSDKHHGDSLKGGNFKIVGEACREITNRNLGLCIRIADDSQDDDAPPVSSSSSQVYFKPDISLAPPIAEKPSTFKSAAPHSHRAPSTNGDSSSRPKDADAELWDYAESHPTVQSLLKTFRGQIVDVRRTDANNNDVINSVANSASS